MTSTIKKIQKFNINEDKFIGVDEVGRGSLIGPVITCAVYLDHNDFKKLTTIPYTINDSKKLSKKTRKQIVEWANNNNIKYYIASANVQEIDEFNIREANNLAMNRAIFKLIMRYYNDIYNEPNNKLNCYIDGNYFSEAYHLWGYPHDGNDNLGFRRPTFKTIIKGDASNIAIALASIIAKEYRDDLITKITNGKQYEKYKWNKNMGYGTIEHRNAILMNGITIHHRLSFLKKIIANTNN